MPRVSMTCRIRHGLLHDAERRDLDLGIEPANLAVTEIARNFEQGIEIGIELRRWHLQKEHSGLVAHIEEGGAKPLMVSVTGSPAQCFRGAARLQAECFKAPAAVPNCTWPTPK